MAKPDFTYRRRDGIYTLYPENSQAEEAWGQIDAVLSDCRISAAYWPAIKAQIERAGYTLQRAARPPAPDDDALLAALGVAV